MLNIKVTNQRGLDKEIITAAEIQISYVKKKTLKNKSR